ncbi:ATP-dependent endonuclease [Halomonas ramblicola]|uniref:ATP-dependent endonuclease n=1 Tax=Halomonas ramblicola TaxID=747349 RepID=UPI0025B40110|nr:ATP-dependent endonuclease [Halomonas ramblicola]MDN3521471.1 ATP-dependent endonuclease [Halomonas ramblicola]
MHIDSIKIENFRLLHDCRLDMRELTTLLVGKNNTGKTSFAVLLEKFLIRPDSFSYSDFPISLRSELKSISEDTDVRDLTIRMVWRIAYTEDDDLSQLSEFMLDLDSDRRHANILFECVVEKDKLLRVLPDDDAERSKFIENNLAGQFLATKIYAFDDTGYEGEQPFYIAERTQIEEKERRHIDALINFQVIHARRNVASSEDGGRGAKPLSTISTQFFKKRAEQSRDVGELEDKAEESEEDKIEQLRTLLSDIDAQLEDRYAAVFGGFLKSSRDFLGLSDLKVVSNLQSQNLIENSSQVIYGDTDNYLPEQHSGLGYLNILYLLLQIELCRDEFSQRGAPLNLLLMEEPEAHTHPQMQYVFADKVHSLVSEIKNLQALLTTHSSHIVSKSNFEDIRYLARGTVEDPVTIKNFHADLLGRYKKLGDDGMKLFQFLRQYLTINSAELFFASKAIFIEGTTESILLPWFIEQYDKENKADNSEGGLSSQNITVLEVGANARAFAPFMDFIDVRTLIITDVDTTVAETNETTGRRSFKSCEVLGSTHTSNETIKHFLAAPRDIHSPEYAEWHKKLISEELPQDGKVRVAYQVEEDGYHARSFEDAFLSLNIDEIAKKKGELRGLKSIGLLDDPEGLGYFELTERVLDKKSDFAGSVLFSALVEGQEWRVPRYIREGLAWIHKS